ncbi:hypothetical protein CLIB1423_14S01266 [[Candida] railenensis]|uniref:Uncharacterized protein n=1 Tax=[Candida] railenensis TaxID=45579 RepID=A0A9P0QSE3_9ASCO|nr:hypothetical protein CLIB1423_14S01266 [[Candida] railenensis]
MALRYSLRKSFPLWEPKLLTQQLGYRYKCSPVVRGLATSAGGAGGPPGDGEAEDDFEIDLISMRRAPKSKKRKEFVDPNSFKGNKPFKSINITKSSVKSIINSHSLRVSGEQITVKLDPSNRPYSAEAAALVDIDLNALDKFVAKYKWQLDQFQKFVRTSYGGKVSSFGQLSTEEFKNSIRIFDDLNKRGKFFVYSEGFQEMIQYLRRLLLTYKDIPIYLEQVLQKWDLDVDQKVFRFMPELNSVSEFVDFETSTGQEVSDYIMKELGYLNITRDTVFEAESFPHGEEICPEEMSIIVQAHRYSNLSKILESLGDRSPIGLFYAIQGRLGYENGEVDLSQSSSQFHSYSLIDPQGFQKSILKDSENLDFFLSEIYNKGYLKLFEIVYQQACCGILNNKNFISQKQFLIQEKGQGGALAVVDLVGRGPTQSTREVEFSKFLEHLKTYQGTKPYYTFRSNELLENMSRWTGKLSIFNDGQIGFEGFKKWVERVLIYELKDPSYFDGLIFNGKLDEIFNRRIEAEPKRNTVVENHTEDIAKPYVQIPDHIKLHNFVKELTEVQETLGCKFGDMKSDEIIAACHQLKPVSEELDMRKLAYKLNELFRINHGETSVLDTVLNSHSQFEAFEKKLAQSKASAAATKTETTNDNTSAGVVPIENHQESEYRQIPDGFILEEFSNELKEVKEYLKIKSYNDVESDTVLAALNDLSNEQLTFDIEKRNIYAKLFRNLSYLFKHNNQHTFVLDNVIQNNEVFEKFESSKISSEPFENVEEVEDEHLLTNYGSIAKIQSLLFWEWPTLVKIINLSNWDSFTELEFKKVSSRDFKIALNATLERIQGNEEVNIEDFKRIISQLQEFNEEFAQFPYILHLLMSESKIEPNISLKLIEDIIEFAETESESISLAAPNDHDAHIPTAKEAATVETDSMPLRNEGEKTNKFDMSEFRKDRQPVSVPSKESTTAKSKFSYHKSDELLSSLTKNEERADFNPGKYDFPKLSEDILTGKEPSLEKLEGYLKDAKKDKEFKKEMKFREAKAYEWSKSMCNSNRSLESKNFFSPLSSFGGTSSRGSSRHFKPEADVESGRENLKNQYLLLTRDGQTIISRENPLGANYIAEDMFVTLNKFPKEDLRKLIKTVKKFQRRNWKLIGGGGQREILVFRRRKSARQAWFYRRVKSMFATAGAVFIALVGINYWLEDDKVQYGPRQANDPRPYAVVAKKEPQQDFAPQVTPTTLSIEDIIEKDLKEIKIPEVATVSSGRKDSGWKNWFWKTK